MKYCLGLVLDRETKSADKCIESAIYSEVPPNTVVIIENGYSGYSKYLQKKYENIDIRAIELSQRRDFGACCDIIIRASSDPWVLCTKPNVVIQESWPNFMHDLIETTHPDVIFPGYTANGYSECSSFDPESTRVNRNSVLLKKKKMLKNKIELSCKDDDMAMQNFAAMVYDKLKVVCADRYPLIDAVR